MGTFRVHVGLVDSSHNEATRYYQAFKNQKQNISHIFSAQWYEIEVDYRRRLTAVLKVIRLLLRQGFGFRIHDESSDSLKKRELSWDSWWHCENNVEFEKTPRFNAPENSQLTSPKVQKELLRACASETRSFIFANIENNFLPLWLMSLVTFLWRNKLQLYWDIYVNKQGEVIERLISVEHVTNTSSQSLKSAIICCSQDIDVVQDMPPITKLLG